MGEHPQLVRAAGVAAVELVLLGQYHGGGLLLGWSRLAVTLLPCSSKHLR